MIKLDMFAGCTDQEIQAMLKWYTDRIVLEKSTGVANLVRSGVIEETEILDDMTSVYKWKVTADSILEELVKELKRRVDKLISDPLIIIYQANLMEAQPSISQRDVNILIQWRLAQADFAGRIGLSAAGLQYVQKYAK